MTPIRGQMAYRAADSSNKMAAVVGVIEAPVGKLEEERVLLYAGLGTLDCFCSVSRMPARETDDPWNRSELAICDLNHALRLSLWHKADGSCDVLQLYLRGTTAEASDPSLEVIAFSGIAQLREPIPEGHQGWCGLAIGPDGHLTLSKEEPRVSDPFRGWTGCSHGSIHSQPIWGWNGEPWGLVSTLTPELQAECQELHQLMVRSMALEEALTPEESRREEQLRKGAAGGIVHLADARPDPEFVKYAAALAAVSGPEGLKGFLGTCTASQQAEREEKSRWILREIMQGRDLGEIVAAARADTEAPGF